MDYLSQQPGGLTDSMFQRDHQQSVRSRNWFSTPWNSSALHFKYDFDENTKLSVDVFHTYASRNSIGFMKDINLNDSLNGSYYNTRQIDRDWYNNLGVETRFLKQYNLLGQKSDYGMVIPNFVKSALMNEPIRVYGDGSQVRAFCHVSDAIDGIIGIASLS